MVDEKVKNKASLLRHPVHFLSLGFGSGLSPWAPGTMGTLVTLPIFYLLALLPWWQYALIVVLGLVVGIWLCDSTARAMGQHDAPAIVWDEIIGYLIGMFLVPAELIWIVAGFFIFRFFDIVKPWPIRVIDQRVRGGLGIMMDDVLAGIFTGVCMHALVWYFGS